MSEKVSVAVERLSAVELAHLVRRNTALLGTCLAVAWSIVQLHSALGAVALAVLLNQPALGGLSPAVFLGSWAAASLPMGRYMDSHGRAPGLRRGFAGGVAGALLAFVGTLSYQPAIFLVGIGLLGAGVGTVNLARAGAADMYPPERRARGISLVLVGAALGAILGPLAFAPVLAGVREDVVGLARPWLVGAVLLSAGWAVTLAIRVDPVRIATLAGRSTTTAAALPSRPLTEILRENGVVAALAAAMVAQAVMASSMGVVGLILVGHGYDLATVSLALSAHFLGMFGLVLVVGQVVDRIGRVRSAVSGLLILAVGVLGLIGEVHLEAVAPAMFAVGLGWNLAYVAATALMADATHPRERARLFGLTDTVGVGLGALGSVVGAAVLSTVGIQPLAVTGALLAVSAAALIVPQRRRTVPV
jgi:MFS family permease